MPSSWTQRGPLGRRQERFGVRSELASGRLGHVLRYELIRKAIDALEQASNKASNQAFRCARSSLDWLERRAPDARPSAPGPATPANTDEAIDEAEEASFPGRAIRPRDGPEPTPRAAARPPGLRARVGLVRCQPFGDPTFGDPGDTQAASSRAPASTPRGRAPRARLGEPRGALPLNP